MQTVRKLPVAEQRECNNAAVFVKEQRRPFCLHNFQVRVLLYLRLVAWHSPVLIHKTPRDVLAQQISQISPPSSELLPGSMALLCGAGAHG